MAKKKNNHNHEHEQSNGGAGEKQVEMQKKEGGDGGGEKKEGKNPMSVVLKIEMHCEGCASKIIKIARDLDGVESVKAETESNKLTVIGKVNPSQIQDILHQKTKKKVDLISPQPKKEEDSNKNNKNSKEDNKKPNDKKPDADNKKPKEPPVTTAVIKVSFHCLGCIGKIQRIVSKSKGVQELTLDKQKETVTVKGTMDVKALTEALKERLKRPVEVVPPKKEKDGNGGEKEAENAGDGSGKKKKGGGGGGDGNPAGSDGTKMEGNKMMQPGFGFGPGNGFGYVGHPMLVYGNGYMGQGGAMPVSVPMPVYGNCYMGMVPQPVYEYGYGLEHQVPGYPVHTKFNDENPNACSVM